MSYAQWRIGCANFEGFKCEDLLMYF